MRRLLLTDSRRYSRFTHVTIHSLISGFPCWLEPRHWNLLKDTFTYPSLIMASSLNTIHNRYTGYSSCTWYQILLLFAHGFLINDWPEGQHTRILLNCWSAAFTLHTAFVTDENWKQRQFCRVMPGVITIASSTDMGSIFYLSQKFVNEVMSKPSICFYLVSICSMNKQCCQLIA